MEFLFRPRSSGKRQVKPSQDIAFLEEQIAGDESSDDSEYKVGDDTLDNEASDRSDASSSNSTSEDDDDDEEEEDDDDDSALSKRTKSRGELRTEDLLKEALDRKRNKSGDDKKPEFNVCGCCLGQTSNDANEIVECDGCGVSVHEGCYGVSESTSVASELSEALTEPWFCEPCRSGLKKTPSCELCPNVGGLYKRTDVGRWVHLVCALYVPGVAFADTENLTNVTIFEMSYANWSRKSCMLCEDSSRMAKTGVCIQCDAGMCKSFFHATCAQKNGLLCEPNYNEADPYLAHCKIHSDKSVIKSRKLSFAANHSQTQRRFAIITQRNLKTKLPGLKREAEETEDERILRKLGRQQNSYNRERAKRHEPWVPTQKIPRALTSSASAIKKLQRMGELKGISVKRQLLEEQQALSVLEARKKWNVAPTFSVEYVAYFHDRDSRIQELKQSLSEQLKQHSSLREKETRARPNYDLATRLNETAFEKNEDLRQKVKLFRDTLCKFKVMPELPALKPLMKPIEIITPNVKAKATVWSLGSGSLLSSPVPDMSLKSCGICKHTKDQHMMVHCDNCRLYYHLGCLTPPLTRMPKKSKLYGWQCSECDKPSSSDEEVKLDDSAPRKKRLAASKALAASRQNSDLDDEIEFLFQRPQPSEVNKTDKPVNGEPVQQNSLKPPPDNKETRDETQRQMLIANADLKEEIKRKKRLEKEQRRAERKRRRKEERRRKRKEREEAFEDDDDDEEEEVEPEIIEHENGQVEVRIVPKAIKLKIKTPPFPSTSDEVNNTAKTTNGIESKTPDPYELQDDEMFTTNHEKSAAQAPPPKKRKRVSEKDVRTSCDKCMKSGSNDDLVRCDECKKCYHFGCLVPPVKKSPKVAGYSWSCNECAPSDVDSDWHLD